MGRRRTDGFVKGTMVTVNLEITENGAVSCKSVASEACSSSVFCAHRSSECMGTTKRNATMETALVGGVTKQSLLNHSKDKKNQHE
ncbi:hypothetical protein SETIT_2G102700v2 [Setaria italica]|uniref:Uncharacterized protein n=1 Tax=Setaria italica TaxID=4555 RepID=A0A368PXH6_SETIT|nr:hypothetical protein SETIT_2G102700v2 [Setaria italica]